MLRGSSGKKERDEECRDKEHSEARKAEAGRKRIAIEKKGAGKLYLSPGGKNVAPFTRKRKLPL